MNGDEPTHIEIITRSSLQLIGCVYYGDPFHSKKGWDVENEIGLLWKRFTDLCERYSDFIERCGINRQRGYEVHIRPENYEKTKKYYLFVGIEAVSSDEIPLEMCSKLFPATTYAVFTFRGKNIFRGGTYIWSTWLPNSGYEEAYPYFMEVYDEGRFYGLDNEKSEIDYWIPIKKER
jgi:AraC family transcriptional regulator